MLRVNHAQQILERLQLKRAVDDDLLERDLEDLIAKNSEAFFGEIGERLLLIDRQVRVGEMGDCRLDLLALDKRGNLCVIELKRGDHRRQLLQAVTYAGMVADWSPEQIVALYQSRSGKDADEAADEVANFVDLESLDGLNQSQRLILVAEEFDYEVLAGAKWLHEQHQVDVKCLKLSWVATETDEFLLCTCIYPHPGITSAAKPRARTEMNSLRKELSWEERCAYVKVPEIRDMFLAERGNQGGTKTTRRPILRYWMHGRRRFTIGGRQRLGYLWQHGRFNGDLDFWREEVGDDASPAPVKEGRSLRMSFTKGEHFVRFKQALQKLEAEGWAWELADEEEELGPEIEEPGL